MDGTAPAASHERISLPFLEQALSRCTLHGAQTVLPRRFCGLHRRAFLCRVLPWYWALLVPIQVGRGQGKQMGLASETPCPFYADPNHLSCFICAVSFSDFILKRSPHMKVPGSTEDLTARLPTCSLAECCERHFSHMASVHHGGSKQASLQKDLECGSLVLSVCAGLP